MDTDWGPAFKAGVAVAGEMIVSSFKVKFQGGVRVGGDEGQRRESEGGERHGEGGEEGELLCGWFVWMVSTQPIPAHTTCTDTDPIFVTFGDYMDHQNL